MQTLQRLTFEVNQTETLHVVLNFQNGAFSAGNWPSQPMGIRISGDIIVFTEFSFKAQTI